MEFDRYTADPFAITLKDKTYLRSVRSCRANTISGYTNACDFNEGLIDKLIDEVNNLLK